MKDKIIKALECISGEKVYCEECSYSALYRYNFCIKRCAKDAIELINRLKRQCDKYRNKVRGQAGELRRLYKQNAEYKAEIERLKKAIKVQDIMIEQQDYKLKAAKSEAIKEFWEKAKQTREFRTQPYVYIVDGDNLVKEMVGDVE